MRKHLTESASTPKNGKLGRSEASFQTSAVKVPSSAAATRIVLMMGSRIMSKASTGKRIACQLSQSRRDDSQCHRAPRIIVTVRAWPYSPTCIATSQYRCRPLSVSNPRIGPPLIP